MGEKLKPCPFCGETASIERYGNRRVSTIYQCDHCSCRLETGEVWDHGKVWNHRTDPEKSHPAPELLECLKDARRLLTDQDAIDLEYVDSVIAKATGGETTDWYAKRAKEERDAGREQNALSYEAFARAALSPDNSTQKKEGEI